MTFANNQEDEEDLHAEEDGEGIADEPGHPETKQRETLLSAAKPVSQTQKGGQNFFFSLQMSPALIADCDNKEMYLSFNFQTSPSLQAWKVTPNIFYETEIHTSVANGNAFSAISLFFLFMSIFSCLTMKMVDIGLKVLDFQPPSRNW